MSWFEEENLNKKFNYASKKIVTFLIDLFLIKFKIISFETHEIWFNH